MSNPAITTAIDNAISNVSSGPVRKGNRSTGYKPDEDKMLAHAWVRVSTDGISGNSQTEKEFWRRVLDDYESTRLSKWGGRYSQREAGGLASRWQKIKKELLKFAGYKARAERERGSGQNDGDVYNVAKDLFLAAEERSLDFEYVWPIVCDQPCWRDWSAKGKGKASSAESGNDGAEGSDARPAGRKQQKLLEERKRKWDEIHEKNIEQNDAFLVEMRRKNTLLQELKENAIMSVNMSTLTDMQRAYYEHMQKEIMEKRNIAQ